jgi:hypothetical protein
MESLSRELPRKEGLQHEFKLNGTSLTVAFEVDLRGDKQQQAA